MRDWIGLLGAGSALAAIATFLSCRSCLGIFNRIDINLNRLTIYRKFFGLHNYFWIIFGIILIIHLSIASNYVLTSTFFGGSLSRRYVVLWIGAGIFVLALLLLLSCRVYPKIYRALTRRNPLNSKAFTAFFGLHSYLWLALFLLVLLHLSMAERLEEFR